MPPSRPTLPEVPFGDRIPRILHQHFLAGEAAIPAPIREIRDKLRAANPGWSYSFWDNERAEAFIRDTYGAEVLARYLRIRPEYYAARSDLLRYLALYAQGGVYLDMKSTCDRPLDEAVSSDDKFLLLHFSHMMAASRTSEFEKFLRLDMPELACFPNGEYVQWVIATVKGHPFLRAVIERVLANIDAYSVFHGTGGEGTIRLTGPIAYSLAVEPIRDGLPYSGPMPARDRGFLYTGLPEGENHHRGLFGRGTTYYYDLRTPIVDVSPYTAMGVQAVDFVRRRRIVQAARRRFRAAWIAVRPT